MSGFKQTLSAEDYKLFVIDFTLYTYNFMVELAAPVSVDEAFYTGIRRRLGELETAITVLLVGYKDSHGHTHVPDAKNPMKGVPDGPFTLVVMLHLSTRLTDEAVVTLIYEETKEAYSRALEQNFSPI